MNKKLMSCRIGILTIIGISITLICGIFYINSFFERFFPENYLIWIGGLLLGLLFIVTDVIYIQKHNKTTILDSRLKVFGIIVLIVFVALAIDTFYFSFFISEYAILFTSVICIIFIIPAVIIGLSFFLILLRTPYAKIVESKNTRIFYIIIAVLLIVLPITLSWSSISPTYQGRQPIHHLSLSSDGSMLLSVSGGSTVLPSDKDYDPSHYDLHVWNTTSGEIIWSECPSKFTDISVDVSILYNIYLSPRGEYFVKYPSMIYNSSTGELIEELQGYYKAWSADGEIIATQIYNHDDIVLYNISDFTSFKTVKIESKQVLSIALSPNGTKLAFMHCSIFEKLAFYKGPFPISVIDFSDENTTCIWNTTNEDIKIFGKIIWPSDIIKLVRFRPPRPHIIKMWNASTGEIINITDDQVFNWSLSDIDKKFCVFDLSYDEKIMALGYYDGIIEIRNATTGMLISTLKTPSYEIARPIPFPPISYLLVGIVVFALIIKRRKSSRI